MKHKVFISYHHKNDFKYRKRFEKLLKERLDSRSVKPNKIVGTSTEEFRRQIRDKHLKDSTVTVVLIGEDTWRRHHVDYEILYSLKRTDNSPRSGVLGIILPSYPTYSSNHFNLKTIPKRLAQNIENEYVDIRFWTGNAEQNQQWIHEAFKKRNKITPNNAMPLMKSNWKGYEWQ